MMEKRGINSTRDEKSGPVVKSGINPKALDGNNNKFAKRVTCPKCKAVLEKSCQNEVICDITKLECPRCGTEII